MSDEDIAKTLFTLLYRHEKKVKKQIEAMDEAGGLDGTAKVWDVATILSAAGQGADSGNAGENECAVRRLPAPCGQDEAAAARRGCDGRPA